MSRIGQAPVSIPQGVDVQIDGRSVVVKGPRGELRHTFIEGVSIEREDGQLVVKRATDQPRHRALHGLSRSLLANMVTGVSSGFSKVLELHGVGYRVQTQGRDISLAVGYSKPVVVSPPPGIEFEVDGTSRVIVKGSDKQQVGQVAADLRAVRPPEPYKGKGIRYAGEYVRRKAGKAGKVTH
ncbi:MAG TPA: 50S ribosomal protein L6 [Dehalococcoidia bacterium]|nr:50S ribosomal protein L6 [Dehalococcoidia bacterium]